MALRSEQLHLRLEPWQAAAIKSKAAEAGCTVTAFIIARCLEAPVGAAKPRKRDKALTAIKAWRKSQ